MNGALVSGVLATLMLILVLFIAVYAYRLLRAARQARDSAARLDAFVREQKLAALRLRKLRETSREENGSGFAVDVARPPGTAGLATTASCGGVGLQQVSADPVFLVCTPDGSVSVQTGAKPPAPLVHVRDPKTRRILELVVSEATARFGRTWSVLASEDESGTLHLRRLA